MKFLWVYNKIIIVIGWATAKQQAKLASPPISRACNSDTMQSAQLQDLEENLQQLVRLLG